MHISNPTVFTESNKEWVDPPAPNLDVFPLGTFITLLKVGVDLTKSVNLITFLSYHSTKNIGKVLGASIMYLCSLAFINRPD